MNYDNLIRLDIFLIYHVTVLINIHLKNKIDISIVKY